MAAWQASFFNALSFLTVIKLPSRLTVNSDFAQSLYSFSFVGLVIGLGLALVYLAFGVVSPFFMLAYLCLITGFLHIDGLADTFDAFFSGKERKKMLEIMRDSRIGSMGAAGIVLALLGKFFAFTLINSIWPLLIIPALSRFAMVLAVKQLPYARKEGLGKVFSDSSDTVYLQIIPIAAIMFIMLGWLVFMIYTSAFIMIYLLVTMYYKSKIGGITGDMTGALCEITETALFMAAAAVCSI